MEENSGPNQKMHRRKLSIPRSEEMKLLVEGPVETHVSEPAHRQSTDDTSSINRNDDAETSQEPEPQSASTGTGPSNVDTPGPIQNAGTEGQLERRCCIQKKRMNYNNKLAVVILSLVYVAKVIFVTLEMCMHGTDRATFSEMVQGGDITLKHVLLKHWDASWETPPYPPSHGDFAVYTKDCVESGINFAVSGYYNAEQQAAGLYKRMDNDSMEVVIKYFDLPDSHDESQGITTTERHFPIEHGLTKNRTGNATIYSYSIADELEYFNLSYALKRMLFTSLEFTIYSFRRSLKNERPYCLRIQGNVTFEDTDINGQVHVNLSTYTNKIKCIDMGLSIADSRLIGTQIHVPIVVIVFCFVSICLAIWNMVGCRPLGECCYGQRVCTALWGMVNKVLDKIRKWREAIAESDIKRCCMEAWERLNLQIGSCYAIVYDVVIIIGSSMLFRKNNVGDLSELDAASVLLGTGCILVWLDSFRYFKFIEWIVENKKFHLLYKVLCRALPDVICYMICAGVIFAGFCFCGFVVLGPYHSKFSTLSSTAVTLFALANADDVYATFYMYDEKAGDVSVLLFSRVFLTLYICIYTYVVVNVLIGMLTSAYEVITEQYEDAKPLNKALQAFIMHPTSIRLRRCLYEILDSGKFTSDDAKELKEKLNEFIEENDEQE